MPIIDELSKVSVTAFLSNPPQYLFRVEGKVRLKSWESSGLSELIHIVPPADKIQEFEVTAEPGEPSDEPNDIEVIGGPMFLQDWAVGVRFISASNSIEKLTGPAHPHPKIDLGDFFKDQAGDDTDIEKALKGRLLLVLNPGDVSIPERPPGEVKIQLDEEHRIASVTIAPDLTGA